MSCNARCSWVSFWVSGGGDADGDIFLLDFLTIYIVAILRGQLQRAQTLESQNVLTHTNDHTLPHWTG